MIFENDRIEGIIRADLRIVPGCNLVPARAVDDIGVVVIHRPMPAPSRAIGFGNKPWHIVDHQRLRLSEPVPRGNHKDCCEPSKNTDALNQHKITLVRSLVGQLGGEVGKGGRPRWRSPNFNHDNLTKASEQSSSARRLIYCSLILRKPTLPFGSETVVVVELPPEGMFTASGAIATDRFELYKTV